MADLYLLDENGRMTQRWEIGDQPVAVGRDETAELTIPDNTLSRRHFLIWREGDIYLIKDLDSQNGTWVGGQRAQGTRLRDNVCIVAGRTVFMFSEHPLPLGAPETEPVLPVALTAQPASDPANIIPVTGKIG